MKKQNGASRGLKGVASPAELADGRFIEIERGAEAAVAAHYALLLGIKSPWQVRRVELKLAANRVELDVEHDAEVAVACPQCARAWARYDRAPQRQWRHLDVMQFATIIRAQAPRCRCPERSVLTAQVPWAEPHGRFTLMFEAFALTVIEAARSVVQAMEILKVDWHTIQEIVRRAVERAGFPAVRPKRSNIWAWTRRALAVDRTMSR